MNLMGFHIQMPGACFDLIERHKPVAALLMDVRSEHIAEARAKSSGTVVIFRKEDGRNWREKDPVAWARTMWDDVRHSPPDLMVADNEPLGHDAVHEFDAFDQWLAAFIDEIRDLSGGLVDVGGFSFAEGNFVRDGPVIPDHFPRSMERLNVVFIHEYWKPHLDSPGMEGYHCLRWPYWLEWFEAYGKPDMEIYVTECGITMGIGDGPDVGWMSDEAKAMGVTDDTYVADLDEYHRRCCAEPRIRAVLPFVFCPWPGEWETFDHTVKPEMITRIMAFDAPGPEPPPPPSTEVRVFDMDGVERDWDWAVAKYGVALRRRTGVAPGEKVYRLVELREKTGPSTLTTKVVGEDGNPVGEADVAFYWPGAPDPPDPPTEVYPHDWYANFVHGETNENGDVGFGMGSGAYHGWGEGGPHAVWVRDPDVPSDICEKLGMLAGTPHDHLDPKLELTTVGEEPEEELEIKEYLEEEWEANMLYIAWPAELSFDADVHATSPASDSHDTTPLEKWEHDGREYALGGVCADFYGDVAREYCIWAYRLPNPDNRITPIARFEFQPLAQGGMKKVICVVDYKEEPPPPEWTMKVERYPAPGLRLLIGVLPEADITVLVDSERVVSGSKPEYGPGGFEVLLWSPGIYTIAFLDQAFDVDVGNNQCVKCVFERQVVPQARLVSQWMPVDDAEDLLGEVRDAGFDCFYIET